MQIYVSDVEFLVWNCDYYNYLTVLRMGTFFSMIILTLEGTETMRSVVLLVKDVLE